LRGVTLITVFNADYGRYMSILSDIPLFNTFSATCVIVGFTYF